MPKACQCAPASQPQNRVAYRCDLDKGWLFIFIFIFLGKNLFYVWVCVVVCVLWQLWESIHPEL